MRLFFAFLFISNILTAQDTLYLRNPSFEDVPHKGGEIKGIREWFDCGRILFPSESAPDIHPGGFWGNAKPAKDGKTYLGMVVRDNESWESVSQRLNHKIESGKCYSFNINLMQSNAYKSPRHKNDFDSTDFLKPIVLRIWGGTSYCNQRVLLAESEAVSNRSWKTYNFEINSNINVNYITLEAFYKTPTLTPYNGHILVDNASDIIRIPCPGEELAVVDKPYVPPHKASRKNIKDTKPSIKKVPKPEIAQTETKKKVINKLDKTKLRKGQTIKIEKLFFEADTAAISKGSYDSLDEIFAFLKENPSIEIEIGGHTNDIPKHAYCDKLSTARAKEVASYLIDKGIADARIQYKGYGKRKPIASNRTPTGRKRNQRVEIKILKIS